MKKLINFELRKIYARCLTQITFCAVLLLSFVLSFSTYQNKYAFDGETPTSGREAVEMDKEIATKYDGLLTDEKVQQMLTELVPKSAPQGLNAIYLYQNTMQSAIAARFSDINGNWNGLNVSDVFGEEQIMVGYVDGWIGASQNMTKIFVILSFAVILMIAPVFCSEYDGVDNIILSSKYGRTKCATAKIVASILATIIITTVVVISNLSLTFLLYGKDGLNCSILFAPLTSINVYIPFNISCGTLIKYQILLAFTGTMSATGITMIFSALCKSQMTALAASVTIYILPVILPIAENSYIFRYVVLMPIYHLQFISIMSISWIKGGVLYAILALPVTVVFIVAGYLVSHKLFSRHQVE